MDVSMAIDLVQTAHHQSYDLAIIVSQDSDLAPAVSLARQVAQAQTGLLILSRQSRRSLADVYSGSEALF